MKAQLLLTTMSSTYSCLFSYRNQLLSSDSVSSHVRILIVDDDSDHREILKTRLSAMGYMTHQASDGTEGFAQMTQRPFNLVICDYEMPRMNGIQFIEKVRGTPALSSTPIIFVTGHPDPAILHHALAAGATSTLLKPYSFDKLHTTLKLISLK